MLPRGGKSTWGWTQNSLFTTKDGAIRSEYEHDVFSLASRFMKRGAKVLRLRGRMSGNALGMENADGTVALLLCNPFSYPKKVSFGGAEAVLPPDCISALLLSPEGN